MTKGARFFLSRSINRRNATTCRSPDTVLVDHSALLLTLNVSSDSSRWILLVRRQSLVFFFLLPEELKSYRDFDLHYTNELPLSSFIPIPEDQEVDDTDVSDDVQQFVRCLFSRSTPIDTATFKNRSKEVLSSISLRSENLCGRNDENQRTARIVGAQV